MATIICGNAVTDVVLPGDFSRASAKVQSELPGRGKQAQKEGEKYAAEAGAKIDAAVSSPFQMPFAPLPVSSLEL